MVSLAHAHIRTPLKLKTHVSGVGFFLVLFGKEFFNL